MARRRIRPVADEREAGVLGNLPRSRPGPRSEKRAAGGPPGPRTQRSGGGAPGKGRSKASKPASAARGSRSARARSARGGAARTSEGSSTDPITGAVKVAGKVAEAGLKAASQVASGVLGRVTRR